MTGPTVAITGQALIHGPVDLEVPGVARLRALLAEADLAVANLEATVAVPGAWPTKPKTLHLTPAEGLECLGRLGIGAVGHANNHAFDLGPPGVLATRQAATAAGLALAGSGRDAAEAGAPAIVRTRPGPVALLAADLGPQPDIVYAGPERAGIARLAMRREVTVPDEDHARLARLAEALGEAARDRARAAVGYEAPREGVELFGTRIRRGAGLEDRHRPEPGDLAALEQRIAESVLRGETVVVMLHSHRWEADWTRTPAWWLDLARGLIDRGAALVAGHGAPVLQPVAFHRGRPILPGLGNLVFHTARAARYDSARPDVWEGVVAVAAFEADGARLRLLPVAVGRPEAREGRLPPGPRPLEGTAADAVFARLTAGLDARDRARVTMGS